ncbi:MAG: Gfo/Idh/MocA family oxidoreductase [Candidatus Hydrogenedentes bacterium]|nr:Gfo/Idh/MocA family oxidoreductase [Candidatus Hydrogenedentota bacterium]
MSNRHVSRRSFLITAAMAASGCATTGGQRLAAAVAAGPRRSISPNEKINIAGIGIGGQGRGDLENCESQNIVALCDVDWKYAARAFNKYPNAKQYKDFRVMLDKEKDIDAVVIATPDNTHAVAAMAAIQCGKHVYCEKPLTFCVEEARKLADAARAAKVATQMGNSGQASEESRLTCDYIWSGALGPVREVHVWTNRPIWPQGIRRPAEADAVPETLDWDLWLGPAPERPFNRAYLPFKWRGWRDFGTGALGDMGCHAFHPIFRALKLGHPLSIEACSSDKERINPETFPLAEIVRYQFPARGDMPPVALTWYDGGLFPAKPAEIESDDPLGEGGTLYIGDNGKMLGHLIIPEARRRELGKPPKMIERSPGHFEEWFNACKGGEPAGANFDVASVVTYATLLGNIAQKTQKRLLWDGEKITNVADANKYLGREYRAGWEI